VEEKFTTIQEIHNEIELCISLESIMKLDDEWAVDLF
jgi:hypothetical protein